MRIRMAMAVAALAGAAWAEGQEGYYYPPITSTEVFDRTLAATPGADRGTRVGFVTQVTAQQLQSPTPPRFAIFAKGAEAEEMIIVALEDGVFDTLYRARAVMAQLSAPARTTEFFVEQNLAAQATYYDMIKIMGFTSLTLSDGKTWSHRVDFR